eukprot:869156-Amphidinium_carterae.1
MELQLCHSIWGSEVVSVSDESPGFQTIDWTHGACPSIAVSNQEVDLTVRGCPTKRSSPPLCWQPLWLQMSSGVDFSADEPDEGFAQDENDDEVSEQIEDEKELIEDEPQEAGGGNRSQPTTRYLHSHRCLVNVYHRQTWPGKVTVTVDTDFAGDQVTRESTTGVATFLGSHCVRTQSNLQSTVSLSSGEAEHYGIVKATAMGF